MAFIKGLVSFVIVSILWLAISVYGGLSGWWVSAIAPEGDSQAFSQALSQKLSASAQGNTALVLLENGQVVSEHYDVSVDNVNSDTLFPLASMSKFFAAYGVMLLVDEGKVELDKPVTGYLSRWQLPASDFDNNKVTVRQLLSHTSGLTDGLGFGDYTADETLPSLLDSLNSPRASKGEKEIKLGLEPGTEWAYSGGGYLILELLVEEVTGMAFSDWMQQAVFTPLNMQRSSYEFLGEQPNTAVSYDADGNPAPFYRYASAAATGLSSSASDLSRFAQALVAQVNEQKAAVKLLRQPQGYKLGAAIWGAGAMLYAPVGDDFVFGHDGANSPAINTSLRINPQTGDAIIALVNGQPGLASELAYEWTLWQTGYPDYFAFDRAIDSAVMPAMMGLMVIVLLFIIRIVRRRKNRE